MTKATSLAGAVVAVAFSAALMSTGAATAATPGPAPSLTEAGSTIVQARMMKRSMMKRRMVRRGGGRTISNKIGAKPN